MSPVIVAWIALTLSTVVACNVVTVRTLLALHPRFRKVFIGVALVCNALWLVLPFVMGARTTPFSRLARACLAPPWFSWLCFILIYTTVAILIGAAWLLFARRRGIRFTAFGRKPSAVFLVLYTGMSIAGLYQALVPLRIERVTIPIAGLPPSLDGFRLGLLSDLHVGLVSRRSRIERIFASVEAERPDAILVAGDFLDDDPFFIPKFLGALEVVDPSRPVFGVLGNHEMYGDPAGVIAGLRGSRMKLLVNEGIEIGRAGEAVWLAGLSDFAASRTSDKELAPDIDRALARRPTGMPAILLSHQPQGFDLARARGIELTLAAHTHGGQLGFRPLGWSLAGVFLPYHMGLYQRGQSTLFVTTGAGHWLVPFRLGMSPEIVVIELRRGRG